jgi:hypothetical protein
LGRQKKRIAIISQSRITKQHKGGVVRGIPCLRSAYGPVLLNLAHLHALALEVRYQRNEIFGPEGDVVNAIRGL